MAEKVRIHLQHRRHREPCFNTWVRKMPWRRKWQHIPVFLPERSHGRRNLVGYSSKDFKELHMTQHTKNPLRASGPWGKV